MKQILVVIVLSFAIASPAASAATAAARSAPAAPAPVTSAAVDSPAHATLADTAHWKVYAGGQLGDSIVGGLLGLQINRMYSLEARYDYHDPVYQPNNTLKSSSAGVAGLAMFPLKFSDMEPFYMFAKAGYERTKDKLTVHDPGLPGFFPPSTTIATTVRKRVTASAGVQYEFSNSFSGRFGKNFVGSDHSVFIAAIYQF